MLFALLGLVVIVLLGWMLFKIIRSKSNQPPSMAPQDAAIAELESAAKLTAGDDERFAVLSSMALRRYFETSKGIEALGRTTDEFLKGLNNHAALNTDARRSLAECLTLCDQVKFAQTALTQKERRALIMSAVKVIRQCETTEPASGQQVRS